jgi:hypothetical protein
LKETLEAGFVDDLAFVYDDQGLMADVEGAVAKIEYKKFCAARGKTTRIAPPVPPAPPAPAVPAPTSGNPLIFILTRDIS